MSKIAMYAGSFDPITLGHMDVIETALDIFDHLVIAVGVHHGKVPLFSGDERLEMITTALDRWGVLDRVSTVTFDGLVVDAVRASGASVLVRGLRDTTDYNYEMQLAGMNATMAPDVRIVFVPGSPNVRHISATLVRQIAEMKGDISAFVPGNVSERLIDRLAGKG